MESMASQELVSEMQKSLNQLKILWSQHSDCEEILLIDFKRPNIAITSR